MAIDLTDAVLSLVSMFTVGIVYREAEEKGHQVLGSGVLVDVEGRRGILSCGHVAEHFEKFKDVGLIQFNAGKQNRFQLVFDFNLILASSDSFDEAETVADLAFTLLSPELAAALDASKGVFLSIGKNDEKMQAFASTRGKFIDVILGMVAEHSGEPDIVGREITSNLRGCLYSGRFLPVENGRLIFEPKDPPEKLPESFGGMSGGGAWRLYYEETEGGYALATQMLAGVASWERRAEKKVACQGWERIDQGLVPAIRKALPR